MLLVSLSIRRSSAFVVRPTVALTTPSRSSMLFLSQRTFHRLSKTTSSSRRWMTTTTTIQSGTNIDKEMDGEYDFDVIVVGGGHAGCEAATAAARVGAKTALITQRLDTIGELSCNPSIGGIGKGHLVREIDALDGVMGVVADAAGIHYRMLNRRKGPAVRGPRAQMDRALYKQAMQEMLQVQYGRTANNNNNNGDDDDDENSIPIYVHPLQLIEASVQDFVLDNHEPNPKTSRTKTTDSTTGLFIDDDAVIQQPKAIIRGVVIEQQVDADGDDSNNNKETVKTKTSTVTARAVIITTGTFLRGVLMLGHDRYSGGRHLRDSEQVEPPSVGLAKTLEAYQFPLARLKTGTPARIDGSTIDWDQLVAQPTENPAQPFSHLYQMVGKQPPNIEADQTITCFQTATNERTHELVMQYEHTLPRYDGGLDGSGNGPRYCPSIYKKVQRFPDRSGHNCFLEPEGLTTNIVYPNGMSGPYPEEIQLKILQSMKGLENVQIVRPGYDVEYDFVNPKGTLSHTLETKAIRGLYLAGQICGTTGYEEAAAQGIVAGTNAGRLAAYAASLASKHDDESDNDDKEKTPPEPFVIGRDEGYIGVLIDDLVTRGTLEPYRMFTSRAEYRITLRADNADLRLTGKGMEYGLIKNDERISALEARQFLIDERIALLQSFSLKVMEWAERGDHLLMGGAKMNEKIGMKKTAEEVLCMPHVTLKDVEDIMIAVQREQQQQQQGLVEAEIDDGSMPDVENDNEGKKWITSVMSPSPPSIYDTVEASVKYKSYVQRQHRDMESWRKAQGMRIPPDLVYSLDIFPTFSKEEIEKLSNAEPATFAEASTISGVTPQSLVYLYHHVTKRNRTRDRSKATSRNKSISNTVAP